MSTSTTAVHLFHKAKKNLNTGSSEKIFDFTLASASVLLASKSNEDHIRLNDLINVTLVTMDRENMEELGNRDFYDSMKNAILKFELLILRALHFDTKISLPHCVSRMIYLFSNHIKLILNYFCTILVHAELFERDSRLDWFGNGK